MPAPFNFLSPREFQKLSPSKKQKYLSELFKHLHDVPGPAAMAPARKPAKKPA
jgi:hypothetical protein